MRDAQLAQRVDETLNGFNVEDVPIFSRTILVSSPVLLVLHLESGRAVPIVNLPPSSVGTSGLSTKPSLIRSGSSVVQEEASQSLPEALQYLLPDYKRAMFDMFRRWEEKGNRSVRLDVFAEGVRRICGISLSDEDLFAVLRVAEPRQGDEMIPDGDGDEWRARLVDTSRLWRSLRMASARIKSKYIEENSPMKGMRTSTLSQQSSHAPAWGKMLQERLAACE